MRKTIILVVAILCTGTAPAQIARQLYDAEMWKAALWQYDREATDPVLGLDIENVKEFRQSGMADVRILPVGLLDEFYFLHGEYKKVSPTSPYRLHADYYAAYEAYEDGNYAEAKETFQRLAQHSAYRTIMPYYLLQIEFLEENYPYVTEHAARLIPETAMPRRVELIRMAAQAWFRQGHHAEALEYIESYRELGGEMAREESYLAGFSLYQAGRLAEAAEELARATGADDALSQNASYHLADIYLRLGDRDRARQSFSIAANSGYNPDITREALMSYAKLLFETDGGLFNETVNVLTRYIQDYPRSEDTPAARELLIAAYYNARDYEAAYQAILQYPDPDNNVKAALQKITYFRALELYEAGDAKGAMELLDTSSEYRYNTKYTALAEYWKGEITYQGGDWQGAIPLYESYLRLSPASERENVMARYALGYAAFNLKQWDDARARFDDFLGRYTTRDAFRADAFNRVGDIDHAQRAYWRAIESYDAAAGVGSGAATETQRYYAAYQRAMMLGLVDRPDRKIESLNAIITAAKGPYVESATYELGRAYISQEKYNDGARVLVEFLGKYPESPLYTPALMSLGLASLNMGARRESLGYYEQVVARAPYSAEAQEATSLIHNIYVEAGDADGYFEWVKRSGAPVDTSEAEREAFTFAAAQRAYTSGEGPRAIEALQEYEAGYPHGTNISTALTYLGDLYYKAGRWNDAVGAYKRLGTVATDPVVQAKAKEGLGRSQRKADFAQAETLRGQGRAAEAMEIWERLAGDVRTPEGAESAYRMIEAQYRSGDFSAAQAAVYRFADRGTPHGYWLGSAFLVLGDIFVSQGDTFQARATYQSIVDGYMPKDDGIIAAAREKIANL